MLLSIFNSLFLVHLVFICAIAAFSYAYFGKKKKYREVAYLLAAAAVTVLYFISLITGLFA